MADAWHLEFLSEEGLQQIEDTAFRLLAEVGIALHHAGAAERLHGLGCTMAGGRVLIPRDVVEWALKNVRRFDTIYSPDASRRCSLGTAIPIFIMVEASLSFTIWTAMSGARAVCRMWSMPHGCWTRSPMWMS